jgi:Xaa-Pro aminopeptidase
VRCLRVPSSSSSSATSEPLLPDQTHAHRFEYLATQLAEIPANAFLIVGNSAAEPDLAAFLAPAHLSTCFLVGGAGVTPHLGYFTEMERDEALGTGLALLDPQALDLPALRREATEPADLLGRVWLRALESLGLVPGQVALAGRLPADELLGALPVLGAAGWSPVGGSSLLLEARRSKTDWEINEIRIAAQGVCEAFRRVATVLATSELRSAELHYQGAPLTAGVLRREIALTLASRELDQPLGNIVAAGYDAAIPHTQGSSERVIGAGESLVVDLYPKGHLFADCTRTFCVPPIPEALSVAHGEVVRALGMAESAAQIGTSGESLQELVCELFEGAGYETPRTQSSPTLGYVHSLGHGVGLEIHERPSFRRGGAKLAAGDVITLEPGLYHPSDGWGVRVENLYLVGENLENLTPLPTTLDPRAW